MYVSDEAAAPARARPSPRKDKLLFRGTAARGHEEAESPSSETESIPRTRASLTRPKAYAKRTAPVQHDDSDSDSGIGQDDSENSDSADAFPSPPPPSPKKLAQSPGRRNQRRGVAPASANGNSKRGTRSSSKREAKRASPPKRQSKSNDKKRKRQTSPSSDDLDIDLNEKAFVKSTGGHKKAALSKKIAALKRIRLRKQGIEPEDETEESGSSSSSDDRRSGSDSDDDDDDDSASSSFVQDDEPAPVPPPNPYNAKKSQTGARASNNGAQDNLKDLGFVRIHSMCASASEH